MYSSAPLHMLFYYKDGEKVVRCIHHNLLYLLEICSITAYVRQRNPVPKMHISTVNVVYPSSLSLF